jgi:hypothetical protein
LITRQLQLATNNKCSELHSGLVRRQTHPKLQLRHKEPILIGTTKPRLALRLALRRSSPKTTTPTEPSSPTHHQSRRWRNLVGLVKGVGLDSPATLCIVPRTNHHGKQRAPEDRNKMSQAVSPNAKLQRRNDTKMPPMRRFNRT